MNLIKQTQAFRVLLWGILLFSLFFNGLPIQAETQCYSERIKDAPTFNIYSGKDHPNNPITWTHNVPPGILDSTMRVGIYIEAYDVDYPVGDEHDRVYFNGVDLGLLEGTNDGWITVEKTIPVSAIQEGVNTVQIYVDELGVGWKTKVRKSELRFYCSSSAPDFSLGVSPPTQQIDQGESTSYTVSLTALNSFASPVDLTVEGLPTGAAGTFTLNPLTPAPTGDTTLTITTDVSTPAGTYPLTIKAKADGIEHSQQVSLKIIALPVPDFTISATPEGRAIIRGNADDFTVNLGAVDGFDSAVNLSVSGLPANTTSAFSLNPLTPTGDTTLTITTTLDSPEGTYPLTIFGEGGGKTHTAQVILKVKPLAVEPDFKLETTPDLRILVQGDNTDYHVKLTALDGFSSAVDLSISGLPSGVTTQFTLDNLTPTAQSVLKVFTTADAAVGRHTLTITAVGGGKTHSKEITLKIEERPDDSDFSIAADPQSRTITIGQTAQYTLTLAALNGFDKSVSLSLSGLPAGASADFEKESLVPTAESLLTVTTTASTPVGTYKLAITAEGGEKTHGTEVTLIVEEEADFTLEAAPTQLNLIPGDAGEYTLTVTGLNGFADAVTLSFGLLPQGVSAQLDANQITPDGSTLLKITTAETAATGSFTIPVTAAGGDITRTLNLVLNLTCPPFTIGITATPDKGAAPLEVQLASTLTQQKPYPAAQYTYNWDLGDGTTSDLTALTHIYTERGEYTVTLTVTDPCGATATASTIIKTKAFDGAISKAFSPSEAIPGDEVLIIVTAENKTLNTFNDVYIRDQLSPHLIYIEDNASTSPTVSGKNYTWHIPQLLRGRSVSFKIKVRVADTAPQGTISNTVYLSHGSLDREIASTPAILTIHKFNVVLRKEVEKTSIQPGETLRYRLTLKNDSSVPLSGIKLTDRLDSNLDYVSYSGGDGLDFSKRGPLLKWRGTIEAGKKAVITIETLVKEKTLANTRIPNTAEVEADQLKEALASDTVETLVTSDPVSVTSVQLTHRSDVPQTEVGRIIRFSTRVANRSSSSLVAPVIEVHLPQGFAYVAGSCVYNGQRISDPPGKRVLNFQVADIPAGQSVALRYQVVIGADASRGRNISRATLRTTDTTGQALFYETDCFINVSTVNFVFYSGLEGTVYLDKDHDLFYSMNDTPLANIEVCISTGQKTVTDAMGNYKFENLYPGEYAVSVNRVTLSEEYLASNPVPKIVVLSDGLSDTADFAIKYNKIDDPKANKLTGLVFYDKNRNKTYDPGEPLADNCRINLDNTVTVTAKQGKFVISRILVGSHSLEVIHRSRRSSRNITVVKGTNQIQIPLKYSHISINIKGEK